MKFQFRLQKFLEMMLSKEKSKKAEIAVLVRDLEEVIFRLKERQRTIRTLLDRQHKPEAHQEWLSWGAAKVAADVSDVSEMEKKMIEIQNSLEMRQEELNQIILRRKGLESMKDKRLQEWRLRKSRQDQKWLDEGDRIRRMFAEENE